MEIQSSILENFRRSPAFSKNFIDVPAGPSHSDQYIEAPLGFKPTATSSNNQCSGAENINCLPPKPLDMDQKARQSRSQQTQLNPAKIRLNKLGLVEDDLGRIRLDDLYIPAAPAPVLTNDVPESRLIIRSLTVRNFKSYAGEQELGPFDRNFTAVVGPNGSGKSNVIDALMFVFGHKAKNIRAKKISALIHKSSQHPNITSCTVAVNFAVIKDENGGQVVKDSGFVVSRTVNIDNSSYYEICKKRVQQKEVIRTLRAYGIDMEYNRFLILQGEIESISLMDPKGEKEGETGMLEYIEDIIGSNRLIEPIKYLKEKAKKYEEEQKEKESILGLVDKDRKELEGPMKKALEFLRLENKLFMSENSLYHLQKFNAEKELEEILESKKKCAEDIKSVKAELDKLHAAKKSLSIDLNKLSSEHDALMKKCEDYKEDYKALEREDAANLMDMKHAKAKGQSLEDTLEDAKIELSKLVKKLNVYESETEELQIKKKRLEGEKDVDEKKATEVMSSLKQETNLLQEKKDTLETDLIKLKENMYGIKAEMDLAKSELTLYLSEEKREKENLENLISRHKKTSEDAKTEDTLLKQEEDRIQILENELVSLKSQLTLSKEEEQVVTQQWRSERMKLEEIRSSQQTSQNCSSLLKGLLNEKMKGRLPGIYGRLGDLGAIDEKYDVAISTACGRLDNIVTDTLSTAQKCVDFLKKNNLGYTTFIALDQMEKYRESMHIRKKYPEDVPRLFDLIKIKNKNLETAFYFAVGETLVAKDVDQATRISMQGSVRHRVVALSGELMENTGTMSGGGGRVAKGKMGQAVHETSFSLDDLNRMKAEVDALCRRIPELKALCANLEESISQKTREISSLQHSVKKRRMHSKAYKENVEMLVSQIAEQKKKVSNVTVDHIKISDLKEKIKDKSKNYEIALKETAEVEEKVQMLQDEILKISKGKFNKAKKTVEQLKKKFDEVSQAITRSSVNMKQTKTKIKKLEAKMQNIENDIDANKKTRQLLRDTQKNITDRGSRIVDLVTKTEEEVKEYKEKHSAVKKEMEAGNEKEHQLKREEIEHKNTMKKWESSKSEKKAWIESIKSKLEKLKLNPIEDQSSELPSLSEEEILELNLQTLKSEIDVIKVQLEDMKPDLSAIKEYEKKEELYQEKKKEVDAVKKLKVLENMRHDELRKRRLSEFMAGFAIIANKLKEIYQMLTLGGDAELELVDTSDPFLKGIEFSVRPPKKSWKFMRNLSGGEKTLSSLALVFALHYYRPTPFYVMDEIDAALDVRNVAIVGYFLKETTKNAQFIIVSLRNVMNELSDHLLGIYKINNCTKNVSISHVERWKLLEARSF